MVLASYNPIFSFIQGHIALRVESLSCLVWPKAWWGLVQVCCGFEKKISYFGTWRCGGGGGGNMKFCMVQAIVFWLFVKLRWSLKTRLRLLVKVKKLERGQSCWCEAELLVTASCGYMCIYSIALNIWGWLCWGTQFSSQSSHYQ